jgi:acetyl-CoA acetyltransferase
LGGVSGIIALRRAARAIQAGDAEMIACLGGDTLQPGMFTKLVANFTRATRTSVHPYGASGTNAVFAMITRAYMEKFGARREDFARICVAQRRNASANPLALLRSPLSVGDYLAARPIAEPLHLFDCVMPCAGAEGFLVMAEARARRLDVPFVRILAADERHNAFALDGVQLRGGWTMFRDDLYAQAGLGPSDLHFLQAYDDYPVVVLLQLEGLGLCDAGEGPDFLRRTDLTCDGNGLPLNTCGGQLSAGQAGFAGGFLGIVEAMRQLTNQTLGGAVSGATQGLVSGYGMVDFDRGLSFAAAILGQGRQ